MGWDGMGWDIPSQISINSPLAGLFYSHYLDDIMVYLLIYMDIWMITGKKLPKLRILDYLLTYLHLGHPILKCIKPAMGEVMYWPPADIIEMMENGPPVSQQTIHDICGVDANCTVLYCTVKYMLYSNVCTVL